MNFDRVMMFVSCFCFISIFIILFNVSGCALVQQATDAIFKPKPVQGEVIIPETSKDQLWQTIKGLTPNWLAIPVIALGGATIWYGAFKLGMAFVIFGSINLFMALATSRFGDWMAVCGLVGSIAAILSIMLAKNKALKEIICGVQKGKNAGLQSIAGQPFVSRNFLKKQLGKQSSSTKKIVQKVKNKLKLEGAI